MANTSGNYPTADNEINNVQVPSNDQVFVSLHAVNYMLPQEMVKSPAVKAVEQPQTIPADVNAGRRIEQKEYDKNTVFVRGTQQKYNIFISSVNYYSFVTHDGLLFFFIILSL